MLNTLASQKQNEIKNTKTDIGIINFIKYVPYFDHSLPGAGRVC